MKTWGAPTTFDFAPQAHWDLGPALGILDFERAAKITGSRFTVLKGGASLLSRALIQFFLDVHTREHGYTEILPPFIVNAASLFGTGQLPKFAADLFRLEGTDWYLAPTAEVQSRTSTATRSSRSPRSRSPTARTRRASAPRRAPRARTRAG